MVARVSDPSSCARLATWPAAYRHTLVRPYPGSGWRAN